MIGWDCMYVARTRGCASPTKLPCSYSNGRSKELPDGSDIPRVAFRAQTPDEMYFGSGDAAQAYEDLEPRDEFFELRPS